MRMSRPLFPVFRSMLPGSVLALALLACTLPALAASASDRTYLASPPDVSKFIAEDGKTGTGPHRYGVEVATPGLYLQGGNPSHGVLERLPDGRHVWRVEVLSPGAYSLEFAFAQLALPEGAEAFIRSRDGSVSRGPIRAADVQPDGRFFSAFVPGDSAILEVAMTAAALAGTEVRVANVAHAYRSIFDALRGNKSGSCNVDTICPLGDAWRDQIDAVGHYTLRVDGGSAVCTGTLIANTRGDTTPYFLTANHCISSEAVADSVVVYWNFQSSTCRTPGSAASGTPLSRSIATHNQSGTALVATSAASDFTLLRLDAAVPTAANPFWSGWDVRGDAPPTAVTIHHPAGHEKRISDTIIPLTVSAYNSTTGSGTTHWRVADWNNGTTEGGSSGSGLWNPNKHLIGQLHGGAAACGNDLPDWYGRLSVSWNGGGSPTTRLRDWLDPTGSGVSTLNGNRATGGGGSMVLGGTADEPSASRVTLPTPNPANASCPAGFFIGTVADGPQAGLTPGAFGMELLLDEPGTRVLAGGLNFGGLIDAGQVGFAAFNIANAANEAQRVNVSLTGSPSSNSAGSMPVRIRIARRTATTTDVVYDSIQTISLASAFTTSIDLPPAFYEATVAPTTGVAGGAPEGQFFFSLTTSFVNRPGGGFQGGVVVGGYHATHPFGGVSGFAAFCLATPHTASMRVLSTPSYGSAGARDLRLQILDAQQAVVVTHPTGGGAQPPSQLANGVAVNGATNSTTPNSSFAEYTVVVPAGVSNLGIATTNATADLDLYVRFGQAPTLTTYDCRPFLTGGNETCSFPTPSAGTYFVRVYGFDTGPQNFTIRASWTQAASNALQNGVAVNGSTNSATQNSSFAEYTVAIPAGASNLNITTSNATADLDLYVRFGQAPSLATFDCRPFLDGGNETCTFPTPSAGTYFVRVYGYATGPQTFTIRATWADGGGGSIQLTCANLNGAYALAQDSSQTYLGFFGSSVPQESIMNLLGPYGSTIQDSSVRSSIGQFGNSSSPFSARNSTASSPPRIIRSGQFLGYLTTNPSRIPGISLAEIDSTCVPFTALAPLRP